MANPLAFKPQPHDPRKELAEELSVAPAEHAEALLAAWELLETAHRQGVLDLAKGLMGGRDAIALEMASAAAKPEAIAALRNLISLGRVLSAIDAEMLDRLARALTGSLRPAQLQQKPPSLWRVARMVFSEDGRRGMAFAAGFLVGLGRAVKRQ